MGWKLAFYIFYGLTSGLAELMPISAQAQGYILSELTALDTQNPLMLLMIHVACLAVVLIQFRYRIAHMRTELKLEFQDSKSRKRQPDRNTVLDAKIVMLVSIPVVIALPFSGWIFRNLISLAGVAVSLAIMGVALYVPQFRPGANRDSRHMSPAEATKLGIWAALSVLPGISRMGMLISNGLQKGCGRRYLFDIAFLSAVPALAVMILLDVIGILTAGLATIDLTWLLFSGIAGVAAFGGAWLAISVMRFLSMKANYSAFAYYCWGLGMFSFILYLIV